MVMVGDFLQLPPVVSQNEEKAYKETHEGKYIFGAEIVKKCSLKHIELEKVFRQEDEKFIEILNDIREGK